MVFKPNESPWSGYRRLSLTLTTSILIFSIITLPLAVVYTHEIYTAPLQPYYAKNPHRYRAQSAFFIFYAPFLPIITILHSAFETALIRTKRLHPLYSLIVAWVFFSGWIVQVMFWWECDTGGYYTVRGQCPQYYLDDGNAYGGSYTYDWWPGANDIVSILKLSLGHVIMVLYFFYVPVTAFSVQKWLMLKKMAALGRRERRAEDFELQSLPRIELQAEEHC